MEARSQARGGRAGGSALVVVAAVLLIGRALPLVRAYADKLLSQHSPAVLAAAGAAAVAVLVLTWIGLWKRPRVAAAAAGGTALAMAALSGNLAACAVAAALLLATLLAGDAAFRLLTGAEAQEGDLTAALGAGLATVGTLMLVLGEAGALHRTSLVILFVALAAARRRRLAALAGLLRGALRLPRGDAPPVLEAAWLSFAALVLLAVWAAVQGPDVSWDALAYHLPEARDIAVTGAVSPLPDLQPQSLLWRLHDTWLSLGFLFGGERVVRFLQFAAGLSVFGAALGLARRIGTAGSSALLVLALAAFPTAMLQLRAAYVDWPAALLVTAAAAQIAARPARSGRLRLAGFLFGGAIAVKVFALFAAPALAILAWRARPRAASVAAGILCALIPLAPWAAWSERHAGSFLAPYAGSPAELLGRVKGGHYFTHSPASGEARPERGVTDAVSGLVRLPYDLVYHSSRFEANGDGYNGILVLLLLVALPGFRPREIGLFLTAALPFLVPWSLLYLPSVRFLFPVYPLYAVFAAEGMRRLTARFSGPAGAAAGAALLAAAAAFPVQLGSGGLEWKVALGRMSREESLAARLPAFPLWSRIGPADRVLLVGENDRFHSPAAAAWRAEFLPAAAWGNDPEAWSRGIDELGLTHVLWRVDRGPGAFPFQALRGRLEPVAQNGDARLLRVLSP